MTDETDRRRGGRKVVVLLVLAAVLVAGAVTAALLLFTGDDAPPNDTFADAGVVTGGQFAGSTADAPEASRAAVDAGVLAEGEHAVWFRWTAVNGGWAYVTAADAGGSLPTVRAYTGTELSNLTRVDVPAAAAKTSGGAAIPAVAGRTYSLAVVGDSDDTFRLVIDQPFGGGRINDALAGASGVGGTIELASSSGKAQTIAIDSLARTTAEPGEPPVDGAAAQHSQWFTWTATDAGTVRFVAEPVYGSAGPFTATVYRATETTDRKPGYSFADLSPVGATGRFQAERDAVYFVGVDGPEEFFELSVTASGVASSVDTAPPTVSCTKASATWTRAEFATVSCTASDTGSGLAQPADATFTLEAATTDGLEDDGLTSNSRPVCDKAGNCATAGPVTGLRGDRKAPVVTCAPPPVTWQADAPAIDCTAVDGGSGLAQAADASRTFTATVAPGFEGRVTVPGGRICDTAGNCTQVAPVERVLVDRRAPVVTCGKPPVGPQRADVTIRCSVVDNGSGLVVPADAEFTLTTSVGAGTSADGVRTDARQVCDLAGNCAGSGPFGPFRIDTSPPSVTCASTDGSSVDAWHTRPLTLNCAITDDGSGLAPGTPGRVELTATLPAGRESDDVDAVGSGDRKVCDRAGACSPVGPVTGVKIDRKAPDVVCPSATGEWVAGTATVTCSVTDGGSGLTGPGSVTLRAEQAAGRAGPVATGTARVCDAVGNCAVAGPVRLLVDRAPPVVTCADPAPEYKVEARIACTVTDAGSGLAGADAAFTLVTSVGDGNSDDAAETDSREICDRAGTCVTAGPFTVDVDLTDPPQPGPAITVPDRITVVAADRVSQTQVVTYALPKSPGATSVECRAPSGSAFAYGWTTVVCEAVSPVGVSYASFPIVVKSLPQLAPSGGAVPGGSWRAVGVGFAPGAAVTVKVDDDVVTTTRADRAGRVTRPFTIPANLPTGEHQLALVGTDTGGDPMLVTSPLSAVAARPGTTPPATVPAAAAELPAVGPAVPPDPGPAPAAPALDKGSFDASPDAAGSSTSGVRVVAIVTGVGVVLLLAAAGLTLRARRRRTPGSTD